MQRADLLTHWSGKDITTNLNSLTAPLRVRYLERLVDVLEYGLWMTTPSEIIHGWSPRIHGVFIKYEVPMTCFTELRLSQAQLHTSRYGLLGFVVKRAFVLDRWGGPVFYVRNDPDEALVGNLDQVVRWLDRQGQSSDMDQARRNLLQTIAFMKPMSNPEKDDFVFLDENEWRIVQVHDLVTKNLITQNKGSTPEYRIPLNPSNLQMLIVPDEECRKSTLDDPKFKKWVAGKYLPILTVTETSQF